MTMTCLLNHDARRLKIRLLMSHAMASAITQDSTLVRFGCLFTRYTQETIVYPHVHSYNCTYNISFVRRKSETGGGQSNSNRLGEKQRDRDRDRERQPGVVTSASTHTKSQVSSADSDLEGVSEWFPTPLFLPQKGQHDTLLSPIYIHQYTIPNVCHVTGIFMYFKIVTFHVVTPSIFGMVV
jgi:hypothetical protein